jgi:hypothetical protein
MTAFGFAAFSAAQKYALSVNAGPIEMLGATPAGVALGGLPTVHTSSVSLPS